MPTITYTFVTGPCAGLTLTDGTPIKHPTAGECVRFPSQPESRKVTKSDVYARLATNPGLAEAVAAYRAAVDAEIAADDAALESACPGISELKDAVADQERHDRQFSRMMDDESNDGARPPRGPKASVADLQRKYPRAALYLRAEWQSGAANDCKATAGAKAMEMLLAGETEEAVARVLDNWLPANAAND